MKIFITSYCDNLELEKAALLTLSSLRIGFPTVQDVTCLWAGGCQEVRAKAKAICDQNGIKFDTGQGIYKRATNDGIYTRLIYTHAGELVLLDSDVIFWRECESFQPKLNVAGRWIPKHFCRFVKCVTAARVHPSFLWIKDVAELHRELELARPISSRFVPYDPIAPSMSLLDGNYWQFNDTLANMQVAIQAFDEDMLDRYDHLFCGSFVDQVDKTHPGLLAKHKAIYANPLLAKGIWRQQEDYFNGKSI